MKIKVRSRDVSREYLLNNFDYNSKSGELERGFPAQTTVNTNCRYKLIRLGPGEWHYMHTLVWIYHHGAIPEGLLLNAIDGDRQNTRIENLRLGNRSQIGAAKKMHANNTTGYRGVSRLHNRFKVSIKVLGRNLYLGLFDDPETAHTAFHKAATELNGQFAGPDTIEKRSP